MMKNRNILMNLIFIMLFSSPTMATSVLLLSLDKLHADADYIFHAQCISNNVIEDEKFGLATYTTFKVIQALKGNLSDTYTIKQFGGSSPKHRDVIVAPGVPQFEVGKRYVVFLPSPSHLGFSSPVGLAQGMFTETINNQGDISVSNGRNFSKLLLDTRAVSAGRKLLSKSTQKPMLANKISDKSRDTKMPLDKFISLIKEMEK